MQAKKHQENTTPTPKLMVHGSDHVKWYFQCSHRRIGWPTLVKAWFAKRIVKRTSKHEGYNNEYQHTLSLNASTENKRVKSQDKHSVDLTWCWDTLHVNDKHKHSLYSDRQENMRKRDKLFIASILVVYDSSNAWVMGSCDSGGGCGISKLDWSSM